MTVLFSVIYDGFSVLKVFLPAIMRHFDEIDNLVIVMINNDPNPEIHAFMEQVSHPRFIYIWRPENIGKARVMNQFIAANFKPDCVPPAIISIDPDVLMPVETLRQMIDAVTDIPKAGVIGFHYENNRCNPMRNVWFPARTYKGFSGRKHQLYRPFMMNVAGTAFGISGEILFKTLGGVLFSKLEDRPYFPDDYYLDRLLNRKGFRNGYLKGATASHMKSGNITLM